MRRNKKHRSVNHRKTTRFSAYIYIYLRDPGVRDDQRYDVVSQQTTGRSTANLPLPRPHVFGNASNTLAYPHDLETPRMRANISLLILSHATPFARVINLRIHRRVAYFLLQCLASSTYSSPFPLPDYPRDAQRRGTSLKEFRPHHAYPTHVLLIILEPVDK